MPTAAQKKNSAQREGQNFNIILMTQTWLAVERPLLFLSLRTHQLGTRKVSRRTMRGFNHGGVPPGEAIIPMQDTYSSKAMLFQGLISQGNSVIFYIRPSFGDDPDIFPAWPMIMVHMIRRSKWNFRPLPRQIRIKNSTRSLDSVLQRAC